MPTILIIDDDPASRAIFDLFLREDGYCIEQAGDGVEGLLKARTLRPDLLLVDLMMPRLDGLGVCRAVRSDPVLATTPLVVLSASDDTEMLARVLDAGADEFVTKPVTGLELRARVRTMLRIYHQQRRLEELLGHRQQLAHMVVHDLKSPLSAVVCLAFCLLEDARLPPDAREDAQGIHEAANRLMALAQELLLVAKSEAGRLVLSLGPTRPAALAEQAVRAHRAVAERSRIALTLDVDGDGVASLDRDLVARVIDNLLSNAVKFSPKGGRVEVRVEHLAAPARVRISVADEGPGVPPEHRDAIFDEFATVRLRELGVPQTGLGLTFCRMVARAHGGSVWVTDNAARGSLFVLEVPQ